MWALCQGSDFPVGPKDLLQKVQTRTHSLLCMHCDLWEGFSEIAVHQGKDGLKREATGK